MVFSTHGVITTRNPNAKKKKKKKESGHIPYTPFTKINSKCIFLKLQTITLLEDKRKSR